MKKVFSVAEICEAQAEMTTETMQSTFAQWTFACYFQFLRV